MLRLQMLGGLALSDGQATYTGAAARRRSLALLALSAAGNGDGISDGRALALLWPEFDLARARNNLKQVTFALRTAVGPDVFDRHAPTIRLNASAVEVDLWAFREALAAGRLVEAVGLYHGPFLEGFHIPGLPEFERWLEGERDRVAGEYARALKSLAQAADSQGRADQSVEWWRRLVTLDPLREAYSVGLVRALAAAGDMTAAMQHARVHSALVRGELDIEPGPLLRAVLNELREGNGATHGTREIPNQSAPSDATTLASPDATAQWSVAAVAEGTSEVSRFGVATEERVREPVKKPIVTAPWKVLATPNAAHRPRSRFFAAVSAVLMTMLAVVSVRAVRGAPARDAAETAVVVLPFADGGDERSARVSAAVTELLANSLDGAFGLHTVAAAGEHVRADSAPRSQAAARNRAARVAARIGAGRYITGDVVTSGALVRIAAEVHDRSSNRSFGTTASVQGEKTDLLALVDRLAAQLLAGFVGGSRREIVRVASQTTSSLEAAKAYFAGEDALRAGRFLESIDNFRTAVTIDDGFALAHYGLSTAADIIGDDEIARRAAMAAMANASRLPGRQKRLLTAYLARQRGDITEAEDAYGEIAADYPADAEAWFGLGETLFHLNPLRGQEAAAAEESFARVTQLDNQNTAALVHLARIAVLEGRSSDARHLVARARSLAPDDVVGRYALHVMSLGGPAADAGVTRARLEREAARLPGPSAIDLLLADGSDEALERFLRQFSAPTASGTMKAYAIRQRVMIAAGRGQIMLALALADSAAPRQRNRDIETRSRLAALDFVPLDVAQLRQIRDEVLSWRPEPHPSDDPLDSLAHVNAHSYLRLHRLGLLSLRTGDDSSVTALAFALDSMADARDGQLIGRTLAASLRAHLAARRGRTEEARRELRDAEWGAVANVSTLEAYDRLLLARLLEDGHHDDDALGYYRQIGSRNTSELPLIWSAALGMARIYERRGDRVLAAKHYDVVADRLREADASLRGVGAEANRKAQELRARRP